MKPVVLFGAGKIAEVLLYFFRHHSDREVVACTVDAEFMPGPDWAGLPCVPFESIAEAYPPQTHDMFVALGYQDMNSLRARKCEQARQLGYTLASYVHPQAELPTDCEYGDNSFIMNNALVHPRVRLGRNVFIWSGAMVGHHSTIGDNCWLTSCCNISGLVNAGANCFFAVNSTIAHGVTLGDGCFVGANALVVKCADAGQVFIAEGTKPFRLNSRQFMRMSKFSSL